MTVTAKFYDRKTSFNGVPVSVINQSWPEDVPYILIYKDGEFTGYAEPWGLTEQDAVEKYTKMFEEQVRQEAEAAAKAAEPTDTERLAAALEFQNLMSL